MSEIKGVSVRTVRRIEKEPSLGEVFEDDATARRKRRIGWPSKGDIKACFDNVQHGILMALVRQRVGDRKVLALLKACVQGS